VTEGNFLKARYTI